MTIQDIATAIKALPSSRRPLLIAIEGYGGSGKTTFAKQLAIALGSSYALSIDDFIIKEKLTEASWDKGAFDRRRLEQEVLIPASHGNTVHYHKLDWDANTLSEPITVPNVDYLIIEGISSYHPDIAAYYDYKVWINTPMEIAKRRGHARDTSSENAAHWDLWAANDLAYQERYHPEEQADTVFDNTQPV